MCGREQRRCLMTLVQIRPTMTPLRRDDATYVRQWPGTQVKGTRQAIPLCIMIHMIHPSFRTQQLC